MDDANKDHKPQPESQPEQKSGRNIKLTHKDKEDVSQYGINWFLDAET